jgi:nicotinate phosphoribosyltransferase
MASSGLDEYLIENLLKQGACIDSFGVGEKLITSSSQPVFGGVYKLVAVEEEGKIIPKIKISSNVGKITTPGFKQVYRLYNKTTNKAIADVITEHHEVIDSSKPYEIFHPLYTWKRKTLTNFYARKLLVPIFRKGKQVYESPSIEEIRNYCKEEIDTLWDEVKRFENPHEYFVDLSQAIWDIKDHLLKENQ